MAKIYALVSMEVNPGQTEAFVAAARACHDGAHHDPTGTHAYEWFLSDDGRSATVVEIYDDAEALALHSRTAGPAAQKIRDHAKLGIEFAGTVPQAVLERMRERLGEVPWRGERILGRIDRRATGPWGVHESEIVVVVARFSVHAGKEAEFRALAEECFEKVAANEPGTLGYEWFLSENGRECLTIDIYANADALRAHMMNAGSVMARILPLVDARTTIYGAVPDEVRSRLKPELGTNWGGRQLHGLI
jgi:quinol monooxygenase YgiN